MQSRGLRYMQFNNPPSHVARMACLLKPLPAIFASVTLATLGHIGRTRLVCLYVGQLGLVWSDGAGGGCGFHHGFGSPGLPIALPYIYIIGI
jgi:hypothetical protein